MSGTLCALLVERRKDLPRREHTSSIEIGNAFVDSLQKPLFVVELIGERRSDQNARRNAGFPGHAFEPLCQIPRNAYLVVHHRTALIVRFIVRHESGKSRRPAYSAWTRTCNLFHVAPPQTGHSLTDHFSANATSRGVDSCTE